MINKKYILSIQNLKDNLHIQVIARLRPDRLNIPRDWIPFKQIDKFVAKNIIVDMTVEKIMELFPKFSINFINWCKDYKLVNKWQLANNWKHISRHK